MDVLVIVVVVLLVLSLGLQVAGRRAEARRGESLRLIAVERKLDLIMKHLGVTWTAPEEPEVVRHLERGEFVHAVKAFRDRNDVSLAEAKAAVDEIARDRGLGKR